MKVKGLEGDYCPTCAMVLENHFQNPKKLIVMCGSVCHVTLQQTGDFEKLNQPRDKRSEERDTGESEQHSAEKAGFVPKV